MKFESSLKDNIGVSYSLIILIIVVIIIIIYCIIGGPRESPGPWNQY